MPVAGGAEGEERFPHPGKPPHQRGGKLGQRGASGATGGECSHWSVAGRTEWDLHRWSVPQACTPQPERCVHLCGQGGAGC